MTARSDAAPAPFVCVGPAFADITPPWRLRSVRAPDPLWHVQFHPSGVTLRHPATETTFATDPREHVGSPGVWLALPSDFEELPAFTPELLRLGYMAWRMRMQALLGDYTIRKHYGQTSPFYMSRRHRRLEFAPELPCVTLFAGEEAPRRRKQAPRRGDGDVKAPCGRRGCPYRN